jgi:hypothetical protein
MKTGALPKQLDLRSLAARGVEITGTLSSDDLPRLIEAGIQVVEPGSATFRFRRDAVPALSRRYDAVIKSDGAHGLHLER